MGNAPNLRHQKMVNQPLKCSPFYGWFVWHHKWNVWHVHTLGLSGPDLKTSSYQELLCPASPLELLDLSFKVPVGEAFQLSLLGLMIS